MQAAAYHRGCQCDAEAAEWLCICVPASFHLFSLIFCFLGMTGSGESVMVIKTGRLHCGLGCVTVSAIHPVNRCAVAWLVGWQFGMIPLLLEQKLLHGPRAAGFRAAPGWSHLLVWQRKAKGEREVGLQMCLRPKNKLSERANRAFEKKKKKKK